MRSFLELESEAVGAPVEDRESRYGKIVRFEEDSWLELVQIKGHRRLCSAQDYLIKQIMDAVEGPLATIYVNLINCLPAHECGEQPCQPENMVKVSMGDEDMLQVLEANAGLQDLALCALAAIDQEAKLVVLDHLGREPAFGGGSGGGCAEEDYFKHCCNCTSFKKQAILSRHCGNESIHE